MKVAIIIPARYASTRFPAKPLALLNGANSVAKPLIARTIEAARAVSGIDWLAVATDDDRIADVVSQLETAVIMTPPECANGTERTAACLPYLADDIDIVVNFQGDALLTPQYLVEALVAHMQENPECGVATVAVRCSPSAYRHLIDDQAQGRVGGTTAILDKAGHALYFSKRVLPHIAAGSPLELDPPVLLHLGLYAYRRAELARYAALPASLIEETEGLEQLRFLYYGIPVAVVEAEPPTWDAIELNNPSDIPTIEAILAAREIE